MEMSLEDHKLKEDYPVEDNALQVTIPLARCLKALKEKYNAIAKLHRDRFEQVKSKLSCMVGASLLTSHRTRTCS